MTNARKPGDHVPKPADPSKRTEPLPWQKITPHEDDPDAAARATALVEGPAYLPASHDIHFINSEDVRGQRLELDYLKPELNLRRQGIEHTIVVFGSTRICEPAAAERRVEELQLAIEKDPDDAEIGRRLQVAKRVLAKTKYYTVARELGAIIGRSGGAGSEFPVTLMTGGGPGMMEAANRGAFDVDAKNIGLNITLPHEQFPNPYISRELCFSVSYFAIRKLHFLMRAKALVVFPGGFGTLDELFETLTLVQTRKIKPLPIVLVGESYWRRVFDVDFLVDEGVIDREDRDLFWFAETAQDIWDDVCQWHKEAGTTFVPGDR